MKLRKYGIFFTILFMLVGTSFSALAESISDPTGDVWHWSQVGTIWSWTGNIGDKPNIDITQVSSTANGKNLTLSLTVAGTIQDSQYVQYVAYYNTTDSSYRMFWSNGKGRGTSSRKGVVGEVVQNLTISGSTLSTNFKVLSDNSSTTDLWGWTAEYTVLGANQTTSEWWGDWAPNSKIPFSTGGNTGNNTSGNNTGTKTPGFEVFPVIAAVAVAAVLLRRRR
jgi:hypothetical protein